MLDYVFKEIPTGFGDSYFILSGKGEVLNLKTDCYGYALVDTGEMIWEDVDRIMCTWSPEEVMDILTEECNQAGIAVTFDYSEMEKHKNAH